MTTIRIRVKPTHVTVKVYRVGNLPEKTRYASAVHALHVIRVAIVGESAVIEETDKTHAALAGLVACARMEIEAAIKDVQDIRGTEL